MTSVTNLTETTLAETIGSSSLPVVVDFWAEWCGPCKTIAPALTEIAAEYPNEITVTKINIDEFPGAARTYDVMSIPTLIVFKDGIPSQRIVGAKPKDTLKKELGLL